MQLGIIGLESAGRTTIFEALTKSEHQETRRGQLRIASVKVPDNRVDVLSELYRPRKTVYAQVEYVLPYSKEPSDEPKAIQDLWTSLRNCDALTHVVRNFHSPAGPPHPEEDFLKVDQELVLADLMVVEKRLERLAADKNRGRKINEEEWELLQTCRAILEAESPLRSRSEVAAHPLLRGYAFLSGKPMLVLFNNAEEDKSPPGTGEALGREVCLVVRGKLEQELAQMSKKEADEFLREYGIEVSAMDRVIRKSYEFLGRISFFTVGEDEVRAWTVSEGVTALDAAGTIHSDMQRGFIRAEVLFYEDLLKAGSYQEARKNGTVRLEGKTYIVKDGDIIHFRFNV